MRLRGVAAATVLLGSLLGTLLGAPLGAFAGVAAAEPRALLEAALDAACEASGGSAESLGAAIPGARALEGAPILAGGTEIGWRWRLAAGDGAEVVLRRIAPGGRLRQVSGEYRVPAKGGLRPTWFAIAGPACRLRFGRHLVYGPRGRPESVEILDGSLNPTGRSEPLNPPVPAGADPGGVAVALVDAGVNYTLPEINARLARDASGRILGYDYWDMDRRPFDANPARSPFFPQRHGTRTASLILREAPTARLVAYRYPRPDMARMAALVQDAAEKGVVVVNMSLGSSDADDWGAFARAARSHPELLFVASAGNDARDIDARPVYPAALVIENLLTVTSATEDGALAPGSNWGERSVDLLVPGEEVLVTGFDGGRRFVSGSSYAAARVSALAACLLAAHPDWRAPELKAAILAQARAPAGEGLVARGFLPNPVGTARGACPPTETEAASVSVYSLDRTHLYGEDPTRRAFTHRLRLRFGVLEAAGWTREDIRQAAREAAEIMAQCGVRLGEIPVHVLEVPERLQYYRISTALALVTQARLPKPAVYFVRDSRRATPFDAETFARANSRRYPALADTVWVTRALPHRGIGLAHELVHLLANSGEHVEASGNLMRPRTAPVNVDLTPAQCERMIEVGRADGLLEPIGHAPSEPSEPAR